MKTNPMYVPLLRSVLLALALFCLPAGCTRVTPATPTAAALATTSSPTATPATPVLPAQQPSKTPLPTKAVPAEMAGDPPILPTKAPTRTPTPSPTPTIFLTPTISPTPTISLTPTLTPPPGPLTLSVDNVSEIAQLGVWGKGTVTSIAWSPDGKTLAISSPTGISLYDAGSLAEIWAITTTSPIDRIAFSPDGKTLASGGRQVILWEAGSGKKLATLAGMTDEPHYWFWRDLSYSPDGSLLVALKDTGLYVWQTANGKLLYTRPDLGCNRSAAFNFSPDSQTIALQDCGYLLFIDADSGEATNMLTDTGEILDDLAGPKIFFLPDGQSFVAGTGRYGIAVISASDGRVLRTIVPGNELVVSPDFKAFAVLDNNEFRDFETGDLLFRLDESYRLYTTDVAFSPNGQTLATSDDEHGIQFWETRSGKLLNTLPWPDYLEIAFGPLAQENGQTRIVLAIGDRQGQVQFMDPETGRIIHSLQTALKPISALALHPDGHTLAASIISRQGDRIQLYDIPTGKLLKTISFLKGENPWEINELAFSQDGQALAAKIDEYDLVQAWDLHSGEMLPDPGEKTWYQANNLGADLNGHLIHLEYHDGQFEVIDQHTKEHLATIDVSPDGLCFQMQTITLSANQHYLAMGCDFPAIPLWDLFSQKLLYRLEGHEGTGGDGWSGNVVGVAFSPYGHLLASIGYDGTLRFWDAHTGKALLTLNTNDSSSHLAFSPDGRYLATTGYGVLRLWGIHP